MLDLQDNIEYIFEMEGIEVLEEARVVKIEKEKVYCVNKYSQNLIFNKTTKKCLTDNTTFGASRTLK